MKSEAKCSEPIMDALSTHNCPRLQAARVESPTGVEHRRPSSPSGTEAQRDLQSLEKPARNPPRSTRRSLSPSKSPPQEARSSNSCLAARGISSMRGAKRGGASAPPRNIFIHREAPSKRPNIIQTSMNPEKGQRFYSNMHIRYVAEKAGRGLADAAPDLEALGGLYNPANPKEFSGTRPPISRRASSGYHERSFNDNTDEDVQISTANNSRRPDWRPSDSTNAICGFWASKSSTCSKGYLCNYKHDLSNNLPIAPLPGSYKDLHTRHLDELGRPIWRPQDGINSVCHFWYNTGNCTKGSMCRYHHLDDLNLPVCPSPVDQQRLYRGEEILKETAETSLSRKTSTANAMMQQIDSVLPGPTDSFVENNAAQRQDHLGPRDYIPGASEREPICDSWTNYGSCNKGNKCQYMHTRDNHIPEVPGPAIKPAVCYFFHSNIPCRNSGSCKFRHTNDGNYPVQKSPYNKTCMYFAKGICRDGNGCKFLHPGVSKTMEQNSPHDLPPQPQFKEPVGGGSGSIQQGTPAILPELAKNSAAISLKDPAIPTNARKSVTFAINKEEKTMTFRRKSVSFDLDTSTPCVDEPEDICGKQHIVDESSKLRKNISIDDYKKRKGYVKSINARAKVLYFGREASQSIAVDFGQFSEDEQVWKTSFASLDEIRLDRFCLAQHFQAKQDALIKTIHCLGSLTTDPNNPEATQIVNNLVTELRLHSGGIIAQCPHFFVLVYASMEEWKFLDATSKFPSTGLRYLIFTSTETLPKLDPPKEQDNWTISKYRRVLMKKIHDLSWSRLLAMNPRHSRHHFYMFIPPCNNRTARLLLSLIKEVSPDYKVYNSNTAGSWDFFVNSPSIKSSIIFIHESMICEMTDLPGLWTLIHDNRGRVNTFWYIVDKPMRNDVFDLPPGTNPGQLTAARLLPHGHCIFLTPSFLVAEPERALQLVRWFRQKARNAPAYLYKLVLCYKGREYLHDVGEEKLDEQDDHNLRNRDNPGREAEEAALGLSWKTNEARFLLHAEIRDILMEPAADAFSYQYQDDSVDENRSMILWCPSCFAQDDEKNLVSWFAGWAVTRMDQYRKFTVIGTDYSSHLRAVRKPHFATPPYCIGGNEGSVLVLPPETSLKKPVITLLRRRNRADHMRRIYVESGTVLAAVQSNHPDHMIVKIGDQIKMGDHVSALMHQAENLTTGNSGQICEDVFREPGKTTYTDQECANSTQNSIPRGPGIVAGVTGYIKRDPVHEIHFEPTIEWVTKRRAETGDGWEHIFVTDWRKFWETFNVKEITN